ncbi:hypothetical protein BS50DRAFT_631841 [Corynespora cassiicola Philippines]|uniref:Uncharacterized protein n=1 Tax=Corynespora cassiicola Philippines TaxID=1448308 RepID=A0A2T2NWS5_CORCC|nr:hypothetical protein BS50DRAFT_631841 [Corynespora cassiicola Philippines]
MSAITQAQGQFSNCGPGVDNYELSYHCKGPSCSSINGFQNIKCNTDGGSAVSCSNDVKCPQGIASYQSNFTFTQSAPDPLHPSHAEPDTLVQQEQHVLLASCAKLSVYSDGTKQGTRVDGGGQDADCPIQVQSTPAALAMGNTRQATKPAEPKTREGGAAAGGSAAEAAATNGPATAGNLQSKKTGLGGATRIGAVGTQGSGSNNPEATAQALSISGKPGSGDNHNPTSVGGTGAGVGDGSGPTSAGNAGPEATGNGEQGATGTSKPNSQGDGKPSATSDGDVGPSSTSKPEQFTGSAYSRRSTSKQALFITFLIGLMIMLPGVQAHAMDRARRNELRKRAEYRVRAVSDKVRDFAVNFGSDLAAKVNSQGQNGNTFAKNLVADVVSSVCGAYFEGEAVQSFTPVVVEDCIKSLYGEERQLQPDTQFLAVFGASLLCDYAVSEAFPIAEEFYPEGCEGLQDLAKREDPSATVAPFQPPAVTPSPPPAASNTLVPAQDLSVAPSPSNQATQGQSNPPASSPSVIAVSVPDTPSPTPETVPVDVNPAPSSMPSPSNNQTPAPPVSEPPIVTTAAPTAEDGTSELPASSPIPPIETPDQPSSPEVVPLTPTSEINTPELPVSSPTPQVESSDQDSLSDVPTPSPPTIPQDLASPSTPSVDVTPSTPPTVDVSTPGPSIPSTPDVTLPSPTSSTLTPQEPSVTPPTTPDVPSTPSTPTTPGDPSTPSTPTTPDTPSTPSTPSIQEPSITISSTTVPESSSDITTPSNYNTFGVNIGLFYDCRPFFIQYIGILLYRPANFHYQQQLVDYHTGTVGWELNYTIVFVYYSPSDYDK